MYHGGERSGLRAVRPPDASFHHRQHVPGLGGGGAAGLCDKPELGVRERRPHGSRRFAGGGLVLPLQAGHGRAGPGGHVCLRGPAGPAGYPGQGGVEYTGHRAELRGQQAAGVRLLNREKEGIPSRGKRNGMPFFYA